MTLSPGTRLGPYEITRAIGAGGMGEVFRARDTKLNRDVAIKVLPAAFAADPGRLARFTREAQTLASLNHPNIATIHGIEDVPTGGGSTGSGSRALVMELVEGEDLSTHVARGPIPIAEALPLARQIAEALEAAHEQGIVHRDLKPANIKVRDDGTVKVLDFGLAKAMDGSSAPGAAARAELVEASHSPTVSRHMTEGGTILGTAPYMSPEQARGKAVDKRTDVWAFGCVLYEMLSGRRAFDGEDATEIISAVMKSEPAWSALPRDVPAHLRTIITRCLVKDRKTRIPDLSVVRFMLDGSLTAPPFAPASTRGSVGRSRPPWALVAALTVALVGALLAWAPWHTVPAPFETRWEITTPPTDEPSSLALSPDGRQIVFVASATGGQSLLWLRPLDQTTPQALAGTEGASYPFWSPDSRSVAFFAGTTLKRLDLGSGLPQVLVSLASAGCGGSWSAAGRILIGQISGSLLRVPATGGVPADVTKLAPGQTAHRLPHFLQDGRHFLFFAAGASSGLYLGSLDSPDSKRIATTDTGALFVAPDWILFLRQGTLMAQHMDLARGEPSGEAVPVADQVASANSVGAFSVSPKGSIAYRTGRGLESQFTWFDRSGKVVGTIGTPDANGLLQPTLSPDGRRVVAYRTIQGNLDLWLFGAGRETRLTFDAGREQYPVWSPDGSRIAFGKELNGQLSLYQKSSRGGDAEELLLASSGNALAPFAWSPDGRFLMYSARGPMTGWDLWVLPLQGKQLPSVVVNSKFDERHAQFSPDGRWVAYASNESSRYEIYLRPFPASIGQVPVSTAGGVAPRWRHDGKELYYIAPGGQLMAVSVAMTDRAPKMGAPMALFQPRIVGGGTPAIGLAFQYDVAPDGRFLINVTVGDAVTAPITVIQNWAPKN